MYNVYIYIYLSYIEREGDIYGKRETETQTETKTKTQTQIKKNLQYSIKKRQIYVC